MMDVQEAGNKEVFFTPIEYTLSVLFRRPHLSARSLGLKPLEPRKPPTLDRLRARPLRCREIRSHHHD